jgi:hypothetical protein
VRARLDDVTLVVLGDDEDLEAAVLVVNACHPVRVEELDASSHTWRRMSSSPSGN